ncbi:MAG: TolC family protein [Burkholderiaceae bacterium]
MSKFSSRPAPAVLALCAAFFAGAAGAAGVDLPLTLETALRQAQQRSMQLPAQDAAAAAAREMAIAAGQLPDPTLKASLTNLPVDGPDRFSLTRDFMTMRSIGVMQEFTRADKLQARSSRFAREAEVADAGRVVALAGLRRETAAAWFDRHYNESLRDLLQSQRSEAALQVEAADAAYRGARGSQADVFAARSALAQIDDRLRQAEREIATAQTRLARWIGDGAAQSLGPLPDLAREPSGTSGLESRIDRHPQLALLSRQEDVARAEVDVARSNQRADWSVEIMYSQRGPAYSNMVSVNLALPLQWDRRNRQDRELSARLANVERLRAERTEVRRDIASVAHSWLQQWHSERDRLAHYDTTLIPLAGERVRAALAAYRGSSGPLNAVLEARRMDIETRMEKLRIETSAATLWARLEYLVAPDPGEPAGPATGPEAAKEQTR